MLDVAGTILDAFVGILDQTNTGQEPYARQFDQESARSFADLYIGLTMITDRGGIIVAHLDELLRTAPADVEQHKRLENRLRWLCDEQSYEFDRLASLYRHTRRLLHSLDAERARKLDVLFNERVGAVAIIGALLATGHLVLQLPGEVRRQPGALFMPLTVLSLLEAEECLIPLDLGLLGPEVRSVVERYLSESAPRRRLETLEAGLKVFGERLEAHCDTSALLRDEYRREQRRRDD